jgi:hypothetical protein
MTLQEKTAEEIKQLLAQRVIASGRGKEPKNLQVAYELGVCIGLLASLAQEDSRNRVSIARKLKGLI